jgi:hypothetical protein
MEACVIIAAIGAPIAGRGMEDAMPDAPEMQDDSPRTRADSPRSGDDSPRSGDDSRRTRDGSPAVSEDPGRLIPPADESLLKSMPGGVIEPAKDGPTGGWGTAGRWFVLAIFIIALFVVLFWLKPI